MRIAEIADVRELALLGAHCDDIAIGAGGTVLTLCRNRPGMRVRALVLCAADDRRAAEERAALTTFCPSADLQVTLLDIPDGRLPQHWGRVKEALEAFRVTCEPDLVLCPSRHDNHQDHRGLAKLVPTVFRDHLTLGYEILKTEPDLRQPPLFWPLTASTIADKIRLLEQGYPSQASRSWFDDETFRSLARIRGAQSGHRYAEGFHPDRMILGVADPVVAPTADSPPPG